MLARVRPMTRAEQAAGQGTPLKVADTDTLLLAGGHGGAQRYNFDRVFSAEEVQFAQPQPNRHSVMFMLSGI